LLNNIILCCFFIDLYNPTIAGFYSALLIAFLLGIVHGITPDEHTWPITFSYAIGSYSTKGGAKAGMLFSLGFTLQRTLLSEIAYIALAPFFMSNRFDAIVYMVVGIVMAISGFYILRKGIYLHWHALANLVCRFFHICIGIHQKDIYEKGRPWKP
jgi:ABC-type nickel/cobalt efflux system permease component RcnA